MDTLVERQLKLEEDMSGLGIARYREQVAKARGNEMETDTVVGFRMLQQAIQSTTKAVDEFINAPKGKGRPHKALKFLTGLEPEVVAFITAKTVLDCVSQRKRLQTAARAIGTAIEEEVWFRKFSGQKPHLWNSITAAMNAEGVPSGMRQQRLKSACSTYKIEHERWTIEERHFVGMKCLDIFMTTTKWVETVNVQRRTNYTEVVLKATEETMKWINSENSRCELLSPVYLPMIVPPLDYSTRWDGGYLSPSITRKPMVKTQNKAFQEELAHHEMPKVYRTVNTLQKTAWQINTDMLPIIKALFEMRSPLGKLPSSEELLIPPFPQNKEDKEAIKAWRREAASIHEGNTKRRSKRIAAATALWVAEKFAAEERMFFPYYCDFRGRVYARPLFPHTARC